MALRKLIGFGTSASRLAVVKRIRSGRRRPRLIAKSARRRRRKRFAFAGTTAAKPERMKITTSVFVSLSLLVGAVGCDGLDIDADEAALALVGPTIVECGKDGTDSTPLRPIRALWVTGDTMVQAMAQCTAQVLTQCKAGLIGVQRDRNLECGNCKDGTQCNEKKHISEPNGNPVADVQCEEYTTTDSKGNKVTRWSCTCGCKRAWHEYLECEPCEGEECSAPDDAEECGVDVDAFEL